MEALEQYDAAIIGVGQAGQPLALALAKHGWKTAIVEKAYLGGTCINYGCTPTKTLIASAEAAYSARRASVYGIGLDHVRVHWQEVKARKRAIVETFRQSIANRFAQAENLTLLRGEASFTSPRSLSVRAADGLTRSITADRIFINTGVRPQTPPLPGLDSVPWLTSTTVMELDELPPHLLILGGGYVALEFGQLFRRLGSEVTIVERGSQLLRREDPEIAGELRNILAAEGIVFHLDTHVEQVSRDSAGHITLHLKTADTTQQVTGTHLLVAVGVAPDTAVLNLSAANVQTDEHGYIRVDERLATTQPGIYALGDVKGGPQFTHISYDDYRIVLAQLLGTAEATTTGRMIPYTAFTDPQLAHVGLHEKEATDLGYSVKIASIPMTYVARALETDQDKGLMKAVIDRSTNQILGATVLATQGGEIMAMLQIAMMGKLPYTALRDGTFAHPTLAESLNTLFSSLKE
ncbi:mercuric reductase [Hymenobacter sp. 15J16-1T3B]|uniref:mercuric reductase n=1 Tax=Hymenobacter sp. 15J16-1T3B TaxID=2886941 RepID=UPI001D1106BB|nr:mercuric reductase [Hymenobacter sp. 15J16-1T3B]MCC3158441.1 mercuric reductase [Hymenobacter sp. 15J16-1T3B]